MADSPLSTLTDSSFLVTFNTPFHHELDYQAKVVSFENETLVLEGTRSPATGHSVHFKIFDATLEDESLLKGRARVDAVKQPARGSTTLQITLQITQSESAKLQEFTSLYNSRKDIGSYIKSLKVGIISSSPQTQKDLSEGLKGFGLNHIDQFTDTTQAMKSFAKERMDCVLSEWDVNEEGSGLQLLKELRKEKSNQATIGIILSPHVDKSRIAQSVEYDIDEFLAKPFSLTSLQDAFLSGIKKRKFPAPYILTLRTIAKLIEEKDYHQALNYIQIALNQDEHPATALYHWGYVAMINGEIDEALKKYEEGIQHNTNHLKCLFGKAFLQKREHQTDSYYETLKQILEIHPEHVNTLRDAFPLALVAEDLSFAASLLVRLARNLKANPTLGPVIKKFGLLLLNQLKSQNEEALYAAVNKVMKKIA